MLGPAWAEYVTLEKNGIKLELLISSSLGNCTWQHLAGVWCTELLRMPGRPLVWLSIPRKVEMALELFGKIFQMEGPPLASYTLRQNLSCQSVG